MNHTRSVRRSTLSAATLTIALLTGCGSPGHVPNTLTDATYTPPVSAATTAPVEKPDPNTFVAVDATGAIFMQWTDDGHGDLTGTVQIASPNNGNGQPVTSNNASFTGTLNDGRISVVINQGLGSTATWTGSLQDNTLTVNMPATDGTVSTVVLHPGNVTAYNAAVTAMSSTVQNSREQQANAAAAANRSAQETAASDAVDAAYNDLQQAVDAKTDTSALDADLAKAKQDLQTTLTDVNHASALGTTQEACDTATTAAQDAVAVSQDAASLEYHSNSASYAEDDLRSKAKALSDQFQQYRQLVQTLGMSTTKQQSGSIANLVKQANRIADDLAAKVKRLHAAIAKLDTQANDAADKINQTAC